MASYPLYVESINGKFYRNPSVKGDGWFVNFFGNGSPELYIIQPSSKSAGEILDSMRIKHKNLQKLVSKRKRIEGKLTPVIIYLFDLVSPIPEPTTFESTLDKIQPGFTFYDFK